MDLRLSQRELANNLKVSKRSIEHWERNEATPLRWMARLINRFLGNQSAETSASLGEQLTAYRRSLGLSQAKLGRMLGVHTATIVRWETGRRRPSKALLCTVENLLKGS